VSLPHCRRPAACRYLWFPPRSARQDPRPRRHHPRRRGVWALPRGYDQLL